MSVMRTSVLSARESKALALSLACAMLLACGGGSGSGGGTAGDPAPPPPPPPAATAGGLWFETFDLEGDDNINVAEGIVAEDGRFAFNIGNEAFLFGQLSVSGDAASGAFDGVVEIGGDEGGIFFATGALDLTLSARETLDGTFSIELPGALFSQSVQGVVELDYDELHEAEPSLAALAGTWADVDDPEDVFSIDAAGALFSQSVDDNCVINGAVAVIDDNFNVYELTGDVSGCVGDSAPLNGAELTGLLYLDETGTTDVLRGGMRAEVPSLDAVIGFWLVYERL